MDRCQVLLQSTREAGQLVYSAGRGLRHPRLPGLAPALPDHRQGGLAQRMRPRDAGIHNAWGMSARETSPAADRRRTVQHS